MPPQTKENGWNENAKLVLHELSRNHEDHKEIFEKLNEIATSVTILKVKAGAWGFLAGAIPTIAYILLKKFV